MPTLRGQSENERILNHLERMEHRLSEWEIGFVADMQKIVDAGNKFTHKQKLKIAEIWERVTS